MKAGLKIDKVELRVVPAMKKISVDCWFARKDA